MVAEGYWSALMALNLIVLVTWKVLLILQNQISFHKSKFHEEYFFTSDLFLKYACKIEPCAVAVVVLKNRKTAHQNRGCGFIFLIFY
jgi:hypothetical protein